MAEILGKQRFHHDVKELVEPITKRLTDTIQKLVEETRLIAKAIESLDESNKYVKTLESMNEKGINPLGLIRPMAKLLVPRSKSQFRLLDEPDSDIWNDKKKNGEKNTLYHDKILFRDTGVVFTLKRDFLSLITDYDFNKTHSPDANQVINFLDDMHFDIRAKDENSRDKNVIKYFLKESYTSIWVKNCFPSRKSK